MLQSVYFLDRDSDRVWRYYSIVRTGKNASALIIPVIGFRDYWNTWKFWATVVAFAVLEVPIVLLMRPLVEKSGFPLLYAFGILDCVFVIAGIYYVCCAANDLQRGVGDHN